MKVQCPHCAGVMRVKEPKPGTYRPTCRQCETRFQLQVTENGEAITAHLDSKASSVDSGAPAPTYAVRATDSTTATTAVRGDSPKSKGDIETPTLPGVPEETLPEGPAESLSPATPELDETIIVNTAEASSTSFGMNPTLPESPTPSSVAADLAETMETHVTSLAPRTGAPAQEGGETIALEATAGTAGASDSFSFSSQHGGAAGGPIQEPIAERLGGYRLLRELGRGAMGAVYVARQIALSRDVALKTIQSRWAESPRMLARFMREAYAAAQLTHHNMVQIYDLGAEGETHFFSMELVNGPNLAELVKQRGRLPAAEAIGLVLQAARGLQAAHNQGLVHRDVKPANLLLSDAGIVKVADLGLVKIANRMEIEETGDQDDGTLPEHARGDLTLAHNAMGTAAFMAPEQGEDAATADHRADIYSLGCTLYVLLTGRPPFEGATAIELITKHKTDPVTRPDAVVTDISPQIGDVVLRMVAKTPGERFANMGEVIAELEKLLALEQEAGSTGHLSEEQLSELATCSRAHSSAPAVKRQQVAAWSAVGGGVLLGGCVLLFNPVIGIGLLGAVFTGTISRLVAKNRGVGDGVLSKARQWLGAARLSDYLTWAASAALLLAALWALQLLTAFIIAIALGAAGGVAFAVLIDRPAELAQEQPIRDARKMLQRMRMEGKEEETLRKSVAARTSRSFVEALFGYAAARELHGKRRLSLRDGVYDFLDARIEQSRQESQQHQLQQVEQKRLESEGVGADEARERAELIAEALATEVRQLREEAKQRAAQDPALVAQRKRERMKELLTDGRQLSSGAVRAKRLTRLLLGPIFGGKTRFLAGAALLAGCLLWIQQNELVDSMRTVEGLTGLALHPGETTKPLGVPIVGRWFNSLHIGLAGLLLVFSAQYAGWRIPLAALPAAAVMAVGPHLGVPGLGLPGGAWTVSTGLGLALFAAGVMLFGNDD
ncbi:MAG: protein kinase [Planctomycetales bacterium]|nr:protein kinase [Planctomycetales bacterium]